MKQATFPLVEPFDHELAPNGRLESVTFRRARGKDMVRLADHLPELEKLAPKKGENGEDLPLDTSLISGKVFEALIELVSCLGDLPLELAGEIDFEDLTELGNKAGDFLSVRSSPGAG